jgi:3-oxoadipate enol-lactonase
MPKAKVNGITLHYELEGEGPPLLLIMGLGGNRLGMAPAVPAFSDAYRCITFDNRGTGESDVPPGPYTIDEMADDVAGLLDHLDLGPVHAVGWSMGGCILQSLLIHHADRLDTAVLLSTLPAYTAVQHPWVDGLLALRAAGADPLVLNTAVLPWAFTPRTLLDHDRTRELLELMGSDPMPTSDAGYAAQAHAIRTYDSRPDLPTVTTPTLVLVGAEDVLTPPSQSIEIHDGIPDSRLVVLPRGSHAMLLEYMDVVVGEIRDFLDARVPARPDTASASA